MFPDKDELHPLFKHKFDSNDQPTKSSIIYKILPYNELLSEQAFSAIIKNYTDLLLIPKQNFDDIYLQTIHNYAELVQSLPCVKYPKFNFNKGQLFLAMLRTSITLEESDNYPYPTNNQNLTSMQLEKRTAIWKFAIFSSALMLDLSHLINNLIVETCSANGENKITWAALNGTMTTNNNNNTHYIYKSQHAQAITSARHSKLNILLAYQIIPHHVLAWMYSEQDIFFEWLSLLDDEASGSGTLHKLTMVSLRLLINEYMGVVLPEQILRLIPSHLKKKIEYHKDSFWKGVEFSLRGEKVISRQTEQNYGIEFLNWLRDGIITKKISVNNPDSRVHMSKDGVFMLSPEIFLEFCRQNPKYSNWQAVYRSFNQLGITKFSNERATFEHTFDNIKNANIKRGIIINDPSYIFQNKKIPSMSTELSSDSLRPIENSNIFPTPREEAGSYLRRIYNPGPELR